MATIATFQPAEMTDAEFEITKERLLQIVGNMLDQARLVRNTIEVLQMIGTEPVRDADGLVTDYALTGVVASSFISRPPAAKSDTPILTEKQP